MLGLAALVGVMSSVAREGEDVGRDLGSEFLGNVTTCGEKTSAVKSSGVLGRQCWPLVSSWVKAVGVLCTAGAHEQPSVKTGGTCSIHKSC